jgi:hypothetical protein
MSGLAVFMLDQGHILPALAIFACGLASYWLGGFVLGRRTGAR